MADGSELKIREASAIGGAERFLVIANAIDRNSARKIESTLAVSQTLFPSGRLYGIRILIFARYLVRRLYIRR